VHHREAPEEPVVIEDVDRVPVGELRHEERREARERRLVVERRGQRLARLREHGQACARALGRRACLFPLGDVGDHDADTDLVVVDVENRVVADEPVPCVVRRRRQRPLDVEIEDGLARLEHLAMERLDLGGELLAEHVSERAAEVLVDGNPVQRRERLVHPHIAEVRVHERQSDRRRSENGVDDGEGLLRVAARVFGCAEQARVVD
jgi:hypothetical protein